MFSCKSLPSQVHGDETFPLRRQRDQCLQYMRVLSEKYPSMTAVEKHRLVKLVLFESARRWVWSLRAKPDAERLQGLKKFSLIEKLCVCQESTESGIGKNCKFWSEGEMSLVKVEAEGYESCKAYNELKEQASMEAQYEASTILCEMSARVQQLTKDIRDDWAKMNPELEQEQP